MGDVQTSQRETRLQVLFTEDRPHAPEHWTTQLPRLLEPMGVAAHKARTGHEAIRLAERVRFHAAVIDLGTPLGAPGGRASPNGAAGLWLLELFRRLPDRPPIVAVRGPQFSQGRAERLLGEALRLGVFSVVSKPVNVEQMLVVFRRLLDRKYQGCWPLN